MTAQTSSAIRVLATSPEQENAAAAAHLPRLKSVQRANASHPNPSREEEEALTSDPKKLMEAVRLGDRGAFEQLVEVLWGSTLFYASQLTGDSDQAHDIAQMAFTRLWECKESLSSSGAVRVWLLRTARNLVVNDHRRTQASTRWAGREAEELVARPPTPLEEAERRELRSAINEAISQLSPRRRESFTLFHLQGLSYGEVAEIMGIRPQSVANYLQAGLADLRVALAPFYQSVDQRPERSSGRRPPDLSD